MERAAALGFTPMMGSELEFYLLKETYAEAHAKGYRGLTPSVPYVLDYHILGTTYDEPFLRADPQPHAGRRDARRDVEGRGVAGPAGDQLPLLRRADDGRQPRRSTRTAPRRSRSSTAARSRSWRSRSRTGSATRVTSTRRCSATARPRSPTTRCSSVTLARRSDRVLRGAGGLPRADGQLVQAVRRGLVGADDARVGQRQPHVRLPGRRAAGRPGAPRRGSRAATRTPTSPSRRSSRPGCTGSSTSSSCRPALEGNAYESDAKRFPSTLRDAIAALEGGTMARAAFGDQVVDHYLNYARTEQGIFDTLRHRLGAPALLRARLRTCRRPIRGRARPGAVPEVRGILGPSPSAASGRSARRRAPCGRRPRRRCPRGCARRARRRGRRARSGRPVARRRDGRSHPPDRRRDGTVSTLGDAELDEPG